MAGKGSNSVRLRQYNERFVLAALRNMGEASKSDLARAANLTPAAVADITDGLEQSAFVKQVGKRFGKRGSPSVLYRLNPERIYTIGLKIGCRALDAVLLDFAGEICVREEHEYDLPDPAIVRRVGSSAISNFAARVARNPVSELIGIGIAEPNFPGAWREELSWPAALAFSWETVELARFFDVPAGVSVFVENDGTTAALAELFLGAGRRFEDFMHISIDTFVGGGLVQHGLLQPGPHGNNAALGPLPVPPSPLSAQAAKSAGYTSLLHRASVYGLMNHLRAHDIQLNRVRDLDRMPPAARPLVQDWMTDCAGALVEAIISICSVIDLEAIVIDGILPRSLHLELVSMVQAGFSRSPAIGVIIPELHSGRFGAQASPVGAASLPISALLSPDTSVLMLGQKSRDMTGTLSGSRPA